MDAKVKKYLQLFGIAAGISGAYLAWDWFAGSPGKTKKAPVVAATAPNPTPAPEETPLPEENTPTETPQTEALSLDQQLAAIRSNNAAATANPYEAAYVPTKSGKETLPKKANQGGNTTPRSGGKSSSGGAGGGTGGGSGGGGTSGGGSGNTAEASGATATPTPTPAEGGSSGTQEGTWIQTGADPRGETQVGTRHNTSCIKYRNVPGRLGSRSEGTPCPICGG